MREIREVNGEVVSGMEKVARAVRSTYGPGGRPAALDRAAGLTWTRDGITVAREVRPGGAEQVGADLLLEACVRTNERAGDGTSATAIVGAAAARFAMRQVAAGTSPAVLGRQMREAAALAAEAVVAASLPVNSYDDLEAVALRACGGDADVARGIRQGLEAAGQDGTVVVEAGCNRGVEVSFLEGVLLRAGARDLQMLPPDGERSMEEPLVAVCLHPLLHELDVVSLLEQAGQSGQPLIVLAPQVGGKALQTLLLNDRRNVVRSVAVEAPGVGEWKTRYLLDAAAASAAEPVDPMLDRHSSSWDPQWFGVARRCSVTSKRTLIHPAVEDSVELQKRCAEVRAELAASDSEYDRDRHGERLSSLSGALCVLKAGGVTEPEARERRTRIEDAVRACQGALRDGFSPGAGCAYLTWAPCFPGSPGDLVVARALQEPARVIAEQLGIAWPQARERIAEFGCRWAGVESFDSTASVAEAIRNGVSAAATGIECGRIVLGRGRTG